MYIFLVQKKIEKEQKKVGSDIEIHFLLLCSIYFYASYMEYV